MYRLCNEIAVGASVCNINITCVEVSCTTLNIIIPGVKWYKLLGSSEWNRLQQVLLKYAGYVHKERNLSPSLSSLIVLSTYVFLNLLIRTTGFPCLLSLYYSLFHPYTPLTLIMSTGRISYIHNLYLFFCVCRYCTDKASIKVP